MQAGDIGAVVEVEPVRPVAVVEPRQLALRSLSVPPPRTFQTLLICRWSCRLPPTAGRSAMTSTPCPARSAPGPSPESCRSFGLFPAPALSTTPRRAATRAPSTISTPVQASPSARRSMTSRATSVPVRTARFPRPRAGRRNALAAFQRIPARWFTSKYPTPSLSPSLKSARGGIPASSQAAANASRIA